MGHSTEGATPLVAPEKLILVEIEINHDCNRVCSYCPNMTHQRKNQGRMTRPLFEKILTELAAIEYAGRISFHFYNEPLLSPDLSLFARLTKERLPRCRIDLYTNGELLDLGRFRELVSAGVDHFTVTRHVPPGKDYPFEKVLGSLDEPERGRVRLQTIRDIELTNRGGLLEKIRSPHGDPPLELPCFIPTSTIIITVNGNVLPCYEDFSEQNVMGNLNESTLLEVWNSGKYRNFRDSLKKPGSRKGFAVCDKCNNRSLL